MLRINKKEDIVIPFKRIGDNDWEINTKRIIDAVADVWGEKYKEPISAQAIEQLEQRLGTTLPQQLKLFYQTFGLANIGELLQEFKDITWIKSIWSEYPEYGPEFTTEENEYLPYLISFSDYLGNGNMFCFHSETKEIYYYDHDTTPLLSKMFDTVDDYLKGCLIMTQRDLFESVKQEEVELWAEEIVSDMFGQSTVKKWMY